MITRQEYQSRRNQLAEKLLPGSIALIPGAHDVLRNGDSHHRFRQNSDFYYLTGFNEPDALLVIIAGEPHLSYLFNQPSNPAEEQWTGPRLGQAGAPKIGITKAYAIETFPMELPTLLANKTAVYYSMGHQTAYEKIILQSLQSVKKQVRSGVNAPEMLRDLEPILSEMRLIKSEAEITLIRRATTLSVNAHRAAMKACKQLSYEHEIEAILLYELTRKGCRNLAYDSIVGSGANACVLHYSQNNQPLSKGELILIDAGGEFDNYAADITRTFPINGRFTETQAAIYDLVLKAQKAAIACIKPGLIWNEMQQTIVRILTHGLCELGLLNGPVDDLIENGSYSAFYMHNSGHWLGLDVHDCGQYKIDGAWRPLKPGMVLTVEPGLYIPAGMEGIDPRWWNIGVRIEDDILVTEDGHENLTKELPVERTDIEALMRD